MLAPVIRADADSFLEPIADLVAGSADAPRDKRRKTHDAREPQERQAFAPPAPVPSWAKVSGRAGEGEALFAAGAGLALLDAFLRREAPAGTVLRQRLALKGAAASAKILRLRADEAALRDLRFAVTSAPSRAAKVVELWRDLLRRPPALDSRRLAKGAASLDLALPDADGLAASLKEAAGQGDPVSAAAGAAALAFTAFAGARPAEAEVFGLWIFDLVLAIRLRWERPLPLLAGKILEPSLRPSGADRRPRPGEAGWAQAAAAGIALASAGALELGADLSRRADTLLAVAPKLRAKPASLVIDMLLAQDCVSSPEAARKAAMNDRSARRLFDRLIALGAARELSGRDAFRVYGL
jgi:Protein of unknown function (DUF1403)